MKKAILIIVLLVSLAACEKGYKKSITTTDDNGKTSITVTEKSGPQEKEIKIEGKVTFNDSLTEIMSLSPNGYVKYTKGNFKLEAKNDANKKPVVKLFKNGKEVTTEDKSIITTFEEALQEIDQLQSRKK